MLLISLEAQHNILENAQRKKKKKQVTLISDFLNFRVLRKGIVRFLSKSVSEKNYATETFVVGIF